MDLSLNDKEWKGFKIIDIFDVDKGQYLNKKDIIEGSTPYITAKSEKNGVNGFIGNPPLFKGNCITVEKVNLSAFYQKHEFYCSHDVTVIRNKKLNEYNGLFICGMINRKGSKYSYGRQAQMNVVKSEILFLPVKNKLPDFGFMEDYIRAKKQKKIKHYKNYLENRLKSLEEFRNVKPLDEKKWGDFFLDKIFPEIKRGKRLTKADQNPGGIPYVSSTASNNGVSNFISNENNVRIFDNCLSIANSGSVGACFYHPYKFVASDHVTKLKNNVITRHAYQFIACLLENLSEKYNYNREISDKRMKREKIMLPLDEDNAPDFNYMVNYIKKIEFEKVQNFLNKS